MGPESFALVVGTTLDFRAKGYRLTGEVRFNDCCLFQVWRNGPETLVRATSSCLHCLPAIRQILVDPRATGRLLDRGAPGFRPPRASHAPETASPARPAEEMPSSRYIAR